MLNEWIRPPDNSTKPLFMQLHEAIDRHSGLHYLIRQLDIRSELGRDALYTLEYLHEHPAIREELAHTERVVFLQQDDNHTKTLAAIRNLLSRVKDIRGSVRRISEGETLNDIELFEIKAFALLSGEIEKLIAPLPSDALPALPALDEVIDLLDPEQTRIPHFYIYDAYSPEITELRRKLKSPGTGSDESLKDRLYGQLVALEDTIREELSRKLGSFGQVLQEALRLTGRIDLLLAKAKQAVDGEFCKPEIAHEIHLIGLFHPQVAEQLEQQGKRFQPVSVGLCRGMSLITGANMGGKTVLLKSVALAQWLFQFGFFVPAAEAFMLTVAEILLLTGDRQDELNGLSSFAAEMVALNRILQTVDTGVRSLVLIDEPARTTNPEEGRALVNALALWLSQYRVSVRGLITTHYSGIREVEKRFRVKGFRPGSREGEVTLRNINDYMDYSLTQDISGTVPREAIHIARILGTDETLLQMAEEEIRPRRNI